MVKCKLSLLVIVSLLKLISYPCLAAALNNLWRLQTEETYLKIFVSLCEYLSDCT